MAFFPMILALASTGLVGTARAACDDPADAVDRVEEAVLDGRFEAARSELARAEASFGCTGRADAPLLARLFLSEGAMAHIEGDAVVRDRAFASAGRVSPATWTPSFGSELRALWVAAQGAERGEGELALEGLPAGAVAMIDGQPVEVPLRLDSGLYLVQADQDGGPPVFARIVLVDRDQTLVVQVDPAALGVEPAPASTTTARGRRKWPWLAAAGGAVALSATSAVLAKAQDPAMTDAGALGDLDAAYGRQKTFAYASYGLGGVGVALLGVGIAW